MAEPFAKLWPARRMQHSSCSALTVALVAGGSALYFVDVQPRLGSFSSGTCGLRAGAACRLPVRQCRHFASCLQILCGHAVLRCPLRKLVGERFDRVCRRGGGISSRILRRHSSPISSRFFPSEPPAIILLPLSDCKMDISPPFRLARWFTEMMKLAPETQAGLETIPCCHHQRPS